MVVSLDVNLILYVFCPFEYADTFASDSKCIIKKEINEKIVVF